jgi:DNA-directed RNA polymerase specialized sigma24 family protein
VSLARIWYPRGRLQLRYRDGTYALSCRHAPHAIGLPDQRFEFQLDAASREFEVGDGHTLRVKTAEDDEFLRGFLQAQESGEGTHSIALSRESLSEEFESAEGESHNDSARLQAYVAGLATARRAEGAFADETLAEVEDPYLAIPMVGIAAGPDEEEAWTQLADLGGYLLVRHDEKREYQLRRPRRPGLKLPDPAEQEVVLWVYPLETGDPTEIRVTPSASRRFKLDEAQAALVDTVEQGEVYLRLVVQGAEGQALTLPAAPCDDPPDFELLREFQDGEEAQGRRAFNDLWRRHEGALRARASRLLAEAGCDVSERDALLGLVSTSLWNCGERILASAHRFPSLRGWLNTVLQRRFLDLLRRKSRARGQSTSLDQLLEAYGGDWGAQAESEADRPGLDGLLRAEDEQARRQEYERLSDMSRLLREVEWQVIQWNVLGGVPLVDIADRLGTRAWRIYQEDCVRSLRPALLPQPPLKAADLDAAFDGCLESVLDARRPALLRHVQAGNLKLLQAWLQFLLGDTDA